MTTPVTRYAYVWPPMADVPIMEESPTGIFVDISDYDRVEAERDRLKAENEALRFAADEAIKFMSVAYQQSPGRDLTIQLLFDAIHGPTPSAKGDAT